ncbi:MAG: polysaccharide deacetylase family protein, partial [Oscillospiraceae bacterium]
MYFSFKLSKKILFKLLCIFCAFGIITIACAYAGKNSKIIGCTQKDLQNMPIETIAVDVPPSGETATDENSTDKPTKDENGTNLPPAPQKTAYLTFDDGPSAVTQEVLATLKKHKVKATFFVIAAPNNEEYLPTIATIVADGHLVALHSCTHEYRQIYK